jgi:hypothetical protein
LRPLALLTGNYHISVDFFPVFSGLSISLENSMRALTREEAARWCRERGIVFDSCGELGYGVEPSRRLEIKLPTTTAGLIYVARILVRMETSGFHASPRKSQDAFKGCLIWVVGHHTWSTISQEIGIHAFTRLGVSGADQSEPADLQKMPARLFEAGEITAATTTLLQPLLFQWDTYVVSESGNYIAYVSNEGSVRSIITRTSELLDDIKPMFKDLGFREYNTWLSARRPLQKLNI